MISDNSCTALAELIRTRYPSAYLKLNEPMSLHTSFRIGGPADIWCAPECADDLWGILTLAAASGVPITIKGNGTNLLVRDAGIRGLGPARNT